MPRRQCPRRIVDSAGALLVVVVSAYVAWTALALGWLGLKPFSAVYEVFLAHWAVTLGVADSLRGRVYQTWVPATSGR